MRQKNRAGNRWLGVSFLCLLTVASPACKDEPRGSISVEPSVVRLTDRIYPENEYVSANFRIVNPSDKPVTVTDLSTSCGCTTAIVDDARKLPLIVAPKGDVAFLLSAFGTAKPEPFQTFVVNISSECAGRSLPDVTASLQFQVEDTLKVSPVSFVAAGLPPSPAKRRLSLITRSSSTVVPRPELKVSNPESISAQLNEPAAGLVDPQGFKTHYTVDVTVTPKRDEPSVTGIISVISHDRVIQTIPVECAFKAPFSLSLRELNVAGSPGDQIRKEIYYEAHDPEWRDVDVTCKPDNIDVDGDQFDKRTQRFRFRINVPAITGLARPAPDQEFVVLTSRTGNHEIKLPVRYRLASATTSH